MPKLHLTLALCSILLLIAIRPAPARADGTLAEAIDALARDIKGYLDEHKEPAVTFGQFRGVGKLGRHASAGPNLVHELTRVLRDVHKVKVEEDSLITALGEFQEAEDKRTALQVVELAVELRDAKTKQKVELTKRYVKNEAALATLLGLTVELPPQGDRQERSRRLKVEIDQPEVVLADARVRASGKSPFGVEILVAPPDPDRDGKRTPNDYKPRRPESRKGLAYVPIQRDEVYAIRLVNDADYDTAVMLSIDGLSMYVFSEEKDQKTGRPLYEHVLIAAHSSAMIRGWYITQKQSDEFKVLAYSKSAARLLQSQANVGTITACFYAAWDPKGPPPPDEPKKADEFAQAADATGRGARIDQEYELVERKVGALRAAVSVRYAR